MGGKSDKTRVNVRVNILVLGGFENLEYMQYPKKYCGIVIYSGKWCNHYTVI